MSMLREILAEVVIAAKETPRMFFAPLVRVYRWAAGR